MLIKNADWVITLDNEGNRYPNSDILIEGAEIKSIGPNIEVKNDVEVLDAKGKVVFPGLINTHHHLYQTLTRNIPATQDLPLFPWLKTIYGIWQNLTPDAMRIATMVGIGELLKTGCTCSSDHHLIFHKNHHSEYMDIEIQVAQELGIRFHATRGSISLGENQGGLPPEAVVENEEDILHLNGVICDVITQGSTIRYYVKVKDILIKVDTIFNSDIVMKRNEEVNLYVHEKDMIFYNH